MTADGTGTCPDCWHLCRLHDSSGCSAKIYPSHSLTGEPCPCEQTPVTAAREELESEIWRTDPASLYAVRAVMAAADRYADLVADERIAGRVLDRTLGPERLADAVADIAAHNRRTG